MLATLLTAFCMVTLVGVISFAKHNPPQKDIEAAVAPSWSGDGSEGNPYLIQSIGDLNNLSRAVADGNCYREKYFKLTNDLDYSGKTFHPIGTVVNKNGTYSSDHAAFSGSFDGDGHMVSNIEINATIATEYVGLGFFACIGYDNDSVYEENSENITTVKNLMINNMRIIINQTGHAFTLVGAISGSSYTGNYKGRDFSATVSNCAVEGFEVESSAPWLAVGGLVGANLTTPQTDEFDSSTCLTISDCIVNNMTVTDNKKLESNYFHCSVISPAYGGTYGYLDPDGDDYCFFCYDIKRCLTNVTDLPMVKTYNNGRGKQSYADVYNKYDEALYSFVGEDLWYAGDLSDYFSGSVVYLNQFLQNLNISLENSGKITAELDESYDVSMDENDKNISIKIKKCAVAEISDNTLTIEHVDGSNISFIADNENYTFDKWVGTIKSGFTAKFSKPQFTLTFATIKIGNVSISPSISTYTINQGSTLTSPSANAIGTISYKVNGTTIATYTLPAGYCFEGDDNPGTITQNVTITPDVELITYNIAYNLNGGSLPYGKTNPTTYKVTTESFTLNNPTKTGYTFLGWTGSNSAAPQTSVTINKGSTGYKTYTANWEATSYTITYVLDGGSASNPTSYTVTTATFTLTNPTKTGYTFLGWSGTGLSGATQTVTINQGSTGDRLYTANWERTKITLIFKVHDNADIFVNGVLQSSDYTVIAHYGEQLTTQFDGANNSYSYIIRSIDGANIKITYKPTRFDYWVSKFNIPKDNGTSSRNTPSWSLNNEDMVGTTLIITPTIELKVYDGNLS